ncbi:MAG: site-2 protease family protein [Acidobacteria bacterium]|nr:site-2 protease family protein [Acidobacteriota bacterium]
MSTSKMKLFRLLGITFQIDLAWILIFALMAFSLAGQFSKEHPNWSSAHYWAVGILTCLLFFVSIILHELAHCLVAGAAGLPVQSITLFILGGVSQIGKEAQRPGIEFLVSVAGPAASVMISAAFTVLWMVSRAHLETVGALAEWLAEINLVLALFNLIPAFPLDGGRMLRSALWGIWGDFSKATRAASAVGRTTAVLFFFGGALFVFAGQFAYGLWTGLIGWFLWAASQQNQRQANLRDSLAGLTASDLMISDCPRIQTGTSLAALEERVSAGSHPRWFVVLNGGSLEGILAWDQVTAVARELWDQTRIEGLMTPLQALRWVHPQQGVVHILEAMDREGIRQVPVVDNGRLLGVLGRAEVYHFLHNRFHATA